MIAPAHLAGEPVETRGSDRENPCRALIRGRRPADPARWHSDAGPEALRALRTLLSGY
ncbi:hypothetical protein [Streptomyces sp. NPDC059468]|uniref:hypothetical protein n=1 Tax=Streptomyces sp. NPDC059468 TaxID=3346845 RepID=UPI0036BD517E